MRKSEFDSQRGVSMIELLVVLVIMAILFTLAAAQFGRSTQNLDRQNIAREFKVALERARFDAVKRRANTDATRSRVTISGPRTFSVTTDLNQNGTLDDPGETRTVDLTARAGNVYIAGTNFVYPVTVTFDQRGQIEAYNSAVPQADINPMFYFCTGPCTVATANAANATIIYVSPTGTVAMLRGDETIPTFAAPTVSNVPVDSSVNPLLAVWQLVAGSPTPSPSPTGTGTPLPTATPTATPTSSPTPTPSPTGSVTPSPVPSPSGSGTPVPSPSPTASPTPTSSPTPTPTPAACVSGQRPGGSPPCTCVAPMTVRKSGKCQ
ncbi:MAG: Tfp pilus assembly protein FimT/FimU [Pyrinomonadaceae bacterium]